MTPPASATALPTATKAQATDTEAPPTAVPQPTNTTAPLEPTPTPILVDGALEDFVLTPEDFPDPYSLFTTFTITNEAILQNYSPAYEQILSQTGRMEGIGAFYDMDSPQAKAPIEFFIVIERFTSSKGASAFFNYDFPDEFRNAAFAAEPIELKPAEEATLTIVDIPTDVNPFELTHALAFRYKNILVLVEGRGNADNVTLEYVQQIALVVLQNLQAAYP